ncbi:MAG: hypothetical protein AAF416_13935 [Pseudomonadota bacterium]
MPRSPASFTQADIKRAVSAARAAGCDVTGLEVSPAGAIRLFFGRDVAPEDTMTPMQRRRARRGEGSAQGGS